jgi:hypothetical protein
MSMAHSDEHIQAALAARGILTYTEDDSLTALADELVRIDRECRAANWSVGKDGNLFRVAGCETIRIRLNTWS